MNIRVHYKARARTVCCMMVHVVGLLYMSRILFALKIHQEQMVMSHSPLKMFQQFHNKTVLVSGQGPVREIAKNLGFQKVVTIDNLRRSYPLLDMVDHHRRGHDEVCCVHLLLFSQSFCESEAIAVQILVCGRYELLSTNTKIYLMETVFYPIHTLVL